MTQTYDINNINNITKEIQNVLDDYDYKKRPIYVRMSVDYQIITIDRLQIENLDWEWEPDRSKQITTYLEWNPFDCRSVATFDGCRGSFKTTKYGLSCRQKPLTLSSYTPLWKLGTCPEEQIKIMTKEMSRMRTNGAKKCENGIEITPELWFLWTPVESLVNITRNTFRSILYRKVQDKEAHYIPRDTKNMLNNGVLVTSEIMCGLKDLRDWLITCNR